MSDVAEAIKTRLAGFTALSTLIGSRIYPLMGPATATVPLLVYLISSRSLMTLTGTVDTINSKLTVHAVGASYAEAHAVADQVKAALHGWRDTAATPRIDGSNQIGQSSEGIETLGDEKTLVRFRVSMDFSIWHE